MKWSFPKCNKRPSKILACNANEKFIDCVLEKRFAHMNLCVYMYMYIFMKCSFPKDDLQTLHLQRNVDFETGASRILEKRFPYPQLLISHRMYIYMYIIHVYVYMYLLYI